MTLYISHKSALEFWLDPRHNPAMFERTGLRDAETGKAAVDGVRVFDELAYAHAGDGEFSALRRLGISCGRIDLLIDDDARRCSRSSVKAHLCTHILPNDSFVRIGPNVCVASPELCFIQIATYLDVPELVEVGYMLCGAYTTGTYAKRRLEQRPPLTTVAGLTDFIGSVRGLHGSSRAERAAAHVLDNSRSPMETALAMSLTLPTRMGGHGIEAPVLNTPIEVTGPARRMSTRRRLVCDLYWPRHGLEVEYDSDEWHNDDEQRARDANRPIVLGKMGIRLIKVTRTQMRSAGEFEIVAAAIREAMGLRSRTVALRTIQARQRLRNELMQPWHNRIWRRLR